MAEDRRAWLRPVSGVAWLAGSPLTAHAHGTEVLADLYACAAAVGACLLALWRLPALRPHRWLGAAGCVVATVGVGWATMDLPFQEHRHLVRAALVLGPLAGAALVAGIALFLARRRRRRGGR